MPKRSDIKSILIIGAGPIVIGQACEFDYSGVQACTALKEEGYRVILVNSNPATIMTDPEFADATYIEPIQWEVVAKIIEEERPDALLPTMGGQTALNCALDLHAHGILEKYNVELIGANKEAIDKAEDREKFRDAMQKIGLDVAKSHIAHSLEEAKQVQVSLGFPVIIRPSFTLGGSGGGVAYNTEEFIEICSRGLELSPTNELLIEESLLGWKEFEMEVVRDKNDNCIIVCSIENFDPLGVHTGDSITVAPAQTLTDKEYQKLRDLSFDVIREIGVETGGSNVQFAINPENGRIIIIEMNPRVSRSSALASKATGFPIAKIAAKLAVGFTLDELTNDITGGVTPASFEPALDYVVTKIPRFNFEKFPGSNDSLTTQMKSVGEVMAVASTFKESLQKAIRSLETGHSDLSLPSELENITDLNLKKLLRNPTPNRIWAIAESFRRGLSLTEINDLSKIDNWFLFNIKNIIDCEAEIKNLKLKDLNKDNLYKFKKFGFSDNTIANLINSTEDKIRKLRHKLNIFPAFRKIDSCAGEFAASTNYLYSSYDQYCELEKSSNKNIMILGGGPNRIGQGIEFDYCCVHAAMALRDEGYDTVMVNCNPETVSTDYNISSYLFFEPLTLENILDINHKIETQGAVIQYGGQTPLKLAISLEENNVPILGTKPIDIHNAEDRDFFRKFLEKLNLKQAANEIATSVEDGIKKSGKLEFPLMVRPSYVLGGRAMEIVYDVNELKNYLTHAVKVSNKSPVLLDRFLDDALELDVDAISDGKSVVVTAIMEHVEQAGVHSGDSACCLPPHNLSQELQQKVCQQLIKMAKELNVCGLVNAQFAIKDNEVYVLEVNPRASRTVPFVSKALNLPLAKIAARCMIGISLESQGFKEGLLPEPNFYAVKLPVFPFNKFTNSDPILGPEMKSTGEVMGIGDSFGEAFAKAKLAASIEFDKNKKYCALLSVRDEDKSALLPIAKLLIDLNFDLKATSGTAKFLNENNVACKSVFKVTEGRPHMVDLIKSNEVIFIINTTSGRQAIADSHIIRQSALQNKVVYSTTIAGGLAIIYSLKHLVKNKVHKLQNLTKVEECYG